MSSRRSGAEFRALLWVARHPGMSLAPAVLGAGVLEYGPASVGGVVAGVAVAGAGWYRAHPDSFDSWVVPVLRAFRRRWWRYVGLRWRDIMDACGLSRTKRKSDHVMVPRLLRVRSATAAVDTLYVKLLRGQSLKSFEDKSGELAAAFKADILGVTSVRPQVVAITVVRGNPFDDVVEATEIPDTCGEVDLSAVRLGEDEYGNDWCEPLLGHHWLGAGAMGSGKSGFIWNALRALGPAIRDRHVVVDLCDLKGGMETKSARSLFSAYAVDPAEAAEVIEKFRDDLKARQAALAEQGLRKVSISEDMPLRVLIIDEVAMMTALGDSSITRKVVKLLAEIMTQGRAAGFSVCAYLQEPNKDILPVRDLFTRRFCLRALVEGHVDMVLGDKARLKGALADELPADVEHSGIGWRVDDYSRRPIRVRLGHVPDAGIAELVASCAPRWPQVIDLFGTDGDEVEVIDVDGHDEDVA